MKDTSSFLKQVRDNWMIIAFIAGLIIGWTDIQDRLKQNEQTIALQASAIMALQTKTEASQQEFAGVNGDIREIKVSLSFIEEKLKNQ